MATFLNPDAIKEKSINFDKLNITSQDLGLSAALKYCGTTTTPLTDGATTNPIIIGGSNHTAESGCVVFYGDKEFIFNGAVWEEFGYPVDLTGYVEKVNGKGLSTNDYTTAEKTKLSGIASGAEVNVQSDWNTTTNTSDSYIKNKPTILKSTDSEGNVLNVTNDKFQINNELIFGNGSSISGTPDTIHLYNMQADATSGENTGYDLAINTTIDGDETIYGLGFSTDKPIRLSSLEDIYINSNRFMINDQVIEGNNKVQQNSSSDNKDFPLLLKCNDNSTNERNSVKYSSNITVNPSTNTLNGGNAYFSGNVDVDSLTIGKVSGIQQDGNTMFKIYQDVDTGITISNPRNFGNSGDILTFKANQFNFYKHDLSIGDIYANVTSSDVSKSTPYAICETAEGVSEKLVESNTFVFSHGNRLTVKFINRNTSSNTKLKVTDSNGETKSLDIYYKGKTLNYGLWDNNTIIDFIYTNDCFEVIGGHTKIINTYTNLNNNVALTAGTFNRWGLTPTTLTISEITNVNTSLDPTTISLNITTNIPTLILPDTIKWVNGTPPTPEANSTLEISILLNNATYAVFK